MLLRQSLLQQTPTSTFYRSNSHFAASKLEQTKFASYNNTFATIVTDVEQNREEEPKVQLEIPENILAIIGKKQAERTSSENGTIMKYLLKKGIFRFLVEKLSLDVVKNIIRHSNLKLHSGGEIFICEGRRIKNVDIILFGEAFIISHLIPDQEEGQPSAEASKINENSHKAEQSQEPKLDQMIDRLIQKVGRETKKFKFRTHATNKKVNNEMEKSILYRKENQNISDDINLQACEKIQAESFLDFKSLFQYEAKHSRTIAAKDTISVLSIPLQVFYQSLLHQYNHQLNQKLKLFRMVSIFDPFQNSKLRTLIEKLTLRQFKKGEMVYREGEEPLCFYLLVSGQVEISKTIGIFSQNPNNLYKNRAQVSRQKISKQIKILPYANFNRVYNYIPEQKMITLAHITPICIFGEEEIIDNRRRQVNARVSTLTATLYEISLDLIDQLCGKVVGSNGQKKMTLANFLVMMQQSVTLKKILFRQNQLSDLVSYENRSKYSTLFESKPRKSRSYKHSYSRQPALSQELQKKQVGCLSGTNLDEAPPQFNNFNYTDFLQKDVNEPVSTQLNEEEERVARLTHVKLNEAQQSKNRDKTIRLRSFSKEITSRAKMTLDCFATVDSLSNKITLQQPLFTVNYFEKQFRDEKKLYVQAKKKRLENIYKHSPQRVGRIQ